MACASPGCNKPISSKLACPKCIQLGLAPAYFCDQECFKANYASHNKIHKLARQIADAKGQRMGHRKTLPDGIVCLPSEKETIRLSLPVWAKSFTFTGSLRPTLLSPKRSVPPSIRRTDYAVGVTSFCCL